MINLKFESKLFEIIVKKYFSCTSHQSTMRERELMEMMAAMMVFGGGAVESGKKKWIFGY